MNIIDTLTAGFNVVTRKLWLITIPVALDLYLWLGPRLSIYSFLKRRLNSETSILLLQGTQAEYQQAIEQLRGFNLFSLLANGLLGVPSLLRSTGPLGLLRTPTPEKTAFPLPTLLSQTPRVISVGHESVVWGLCILLFLASLLIGCLYLGLIAQQVRDGRLDVARLLKHALGWWTRLSAMGLLLFLGLLLVIVPALVISLIIGGINQGIGSFLMNIATLTIVWVGMWLYFYFYFFTDALVLNETGIGRALWNSFAVVRRNFWSTIGLIALIFVIGAGFTIVWRMMAVSPLGTAVGIVGNAYVGSGLTAATLVFYKDRYTKWQEALEGIANERE